MLSSVLAGASGALGVAALWEALTALERARPLMALAAALAPLRAGASGERDVTAAERRRLALTAVLVLAALGALLAGTGGALLLGVLGPLAAAMLVRRRRRRWRARVQSGAPAAARALADALAAGHSLAGAIGLVARDGALEGPARSALVIACEALALGLAMDESLSRLCSVAGPGAWDDLTAAIVLQQRSGGDLAGLLRTTADGLDREAAVDDAARTASSQARLTARIVLGLPLLAVLAGELSAPGTLSAMLEQSLPRLLVLAALVLQGGSLLAVRRIARVVDG